MMTVLALQSVSYGSGSFSGEQYTDTLTLGDLTITNQGISVASQSSGFQGVDGILGYVLSSHKRVQLRANVFY